MQIFNINSYCKNGENIAVLKVTENLYHPPHQHDCIEIVYILSGSGEHSINDTSYEVSRGSVLFINYNQTHSFNIKEEMTYFNILIKPEAVSDKIINSENAFEILSLTAFEDLRSANTPCSFMKLEGEELLKTENIINERISYSSSFIYFPSYASPYKQISRNPPRNNRIYRNSSSRKNIFRRTFKKMFLFSQIFQPHFQTMLRCNSY